MAIPIFTKMINTMKINKEAMYKSAGRGFTNATDAADWLVKHGVPFREAHEIIGKLVLYSIEKDKMLEELTIAEYKNISNRFDETIYESITLEACVNNRKVDGGPSKESVEKVIFIHKNYLLNHSIKN